MNINRVELWGKLKKAEKIVTRQGDEISTAWIEVERTSGKRDNLLVISDEEIKEGFAKVSGQIRSRRENNGLQVYIYAEHIGPNEDKIYANEVMLEGYVCSEPFFKEARSRTLKAFMVVNNGNRSYYIPSVCWGKNAYNDIEVGDKVVIKGRFQSRLYIKEGKINETHEVSIYDFANI